jgi:hypothetical protein
VTPAGLAAPNQFRFLDSTLCHSMAALVPICQASLPNWHNRIAHVLGEYMS